MPIPKTPNNMSLNYKVGDAQDLYRGSSDAVQFIPFTHTVNLLMPSSLAHMYNRRHGITSGLYCLQHSMLLFAYC